MGGGELRIMVDNTKRPRRVHNFLLLAILAVVAKFHILALKIKRLEGGK